MASRKPSSLQPVRAGIALLCAAVGVFFWDQPFLRPLKLLSVMVHETGHALATLLVGGEVTRVTLAADESGACLSRIPIGFFAEVLVYSAGYVGSAIAAGLLLIATFRWGGRRVVLGIASGWLLAMGLIYGGDAFTIGFCLLFSIAFGLSARVLPDRAVEGVNLFLASFACLYAAADLKDDLWNSAVRGQSDAALLARLTVLPAILWALLWTLLSLGALLLAARYAFGRGQEKLPSRSHPVGEEGR